MGTVYLTTNPPSKVSLADYNAVTLAVQSAIGGLKVVPYGTTAPNPYTCPVYVDTTTIPPTLKGWNGSGWVAIGGGTGTGGGTTSTLGYVGTAVVGTSTIGA